MAAAGDTKTPISILQRRKSIETPSASSSSSSSYTTNTTTSSSSLSLLLSSSPADYYELVSLKPASYTSLRDILPSPAAFVQSPKPPSFAANSSYEISIRNRLVKQAAWAYLRPMSTSPGAGASTVFHRFWNRFSDAFFRFVSQICNCFVP